MERIAGDGDAAAFRFMARNIPGGFNVAALDFLVVFHELKTQSATFPRF
jgi:hypothetical protein